MVRKSWIVLGTDGRHVTLGRHTDPSDDEVALSEDALRRQGLAGWLAILSGAYYERGSVEILQVRPLAAPSTDAWEGAVAAFKARRALATAS